MRSIIKATFIFLITGCLIFQTGCWDMQLFEEIGFMLQIGIEEGPEDKILFSLTSPVVAPEAKEKVEFQYTSSAFSVRRSRENVRNASGKLLQGGKVQLIHFSKGLAEKGIGNYMDIFLRNPENPLLANVTVVDGSPKGMMETSLSYKDKARSAIYAAELLRDAHRRLSAPETRVFNFIIESKSKTIDPVTPLFRYDDKNMIIAGSALFSGDRMVGTIDTTQTTLLNVLKGEKGEFEYTYEGKIPEGFGNTASLKLEYANRKIKIDTSGNNPLININLELKATLDEYNGPDDLDKAKNKEMLEEVVAGSFQGNTLKLLKYLQSVGADPIGFGEIVRSTQNDYWKSVNWKEKYKNAEININVKIHIEIYGIVR